MSDKSQRYQNQYEKTHLYQKSEEHREKIRKLALELNKKKVDASRLKSVVIKAENNCAPLAQITRTKVSAPKQRKPLAQSPAKSKQQQSQAEQVSVQLQPQVNDDILDIDFNELIDDLHQHTPLKKVSDHFPSFSIIWPLPSSPSPALPLTPGKKLFNANVTVSFDNELCSANTAPPKLIKSPETKILDLRNKCVPAGVQMAIFVKGGTKLTKNALKKITRNLTKDL